MTTFMNLLLIFENFVKSMASCLSKLKVTPNFGFPFKIPDDLTTTNNYVMFTNFSKYKAN